MTSRTHSNMEHSFDRVNEPRLVLDFRNVIEEYISHRLGIVLFERDVDARREYAVCLDDEMVRKLRMVFDDPKRLNAVVSVEFATGGDTVLGNGEHDRLRRAIEEEITDHADQDKGDGRERAVGEESIGDDGDDDEDDRRVGLLRFEEGRYVFDGFPPDECFAGLEGMIVLIRFLGRGARNFGTEKRLRVARG